MSGATCSTHCYCYYYHDDDCYDHGCYDYCYCFFYHYYHYDYYYHYDCCSSEYDSNQYDHYSRYHYYDYCYYCCGCYYHYHYHYYEDCYMGRRGNWGCSGCLDFLDCSDRAAARISPIARIFDSTKTDD